MEVLSLQNISPTANRILFLRTPGAGVWRLYWQNSFIGISHLRPWPNLWQSGFGIRYRQFDLRQMGPQAVWIGKPFTDSGDGFSIVSGTFSFVNTQLLLSGLSKPLAIPSQPQWDSPITIFGPANVPPASLSGKVSVWILRVPDWAVIAAFGVLPIVWIFTAARRLVPRKKDGGSCCAVCGYDLRATPDRCPECGTIPEKAV